MPKDILQNILLVDNINMHPSLEWTCLCNIRFSILILSYVNVFFSKTLYLSTFLCNASNVLMFINCVSLEWNIDHSLLISRREIWLFCLLWGKEVKKRLLINCCKRRGDDGERLKCPFFQSKRKRKRKQDHCPQIISLE